ncbi:GTP-binding protein Rheb isoform X2 [Eurytemora carolleeae]|uniref:GTP-binding protein Rheb isoform X2 n=1 Tax=Eurytemora carolleeae TaxID=1294199 RepID=UPI000C7571B4|nr:GTP-binding protein Rheb isoform X2 [Eurytemora carolleeae]|eukprot:XP_023343355.1 GTP-binding protein Rheb-like isoform X2 [Eurytemora affinis]
MPIKHRKIMLLGCRSVGKSSLTIQYVQGQFVDSYDPTIENTYNKTVKINNQDFELQVVDTAGQDEYSLFPAQYAVDVHGYVLVYSIDSSKSFEIVRTIYEKIMDMIGNPNVPVVVVGNKSDLQAEREVSREEGEGLAKDVNAVFLETSAKDNLCVNDLFQKIVVQIERSAGDGVDGGADKKCIIS